MKYYVLIEIAIGYLKAAQASLVEEKGAWARNLSPKLIEIVIQIDDLRKKAFIDRESEMKE